MIEKIKESLKKVELLEKEYKAKVDEIVSEFEDVGIISLRNNEYLGNSVQFYEAEKLKQFANGKELNVVVKDDKDYPYELSFHENDIEFCVVLTARGYQKYLDSQKTEEVDETEKARALLTEQERKMKEAGMKESDFS